MMRRFSCPVPQPAVRALPVRCRLAPLVFLGLLAVATSGVRAEDAPKNTPPFLHFKMVSAGGVVNSTLPFDVPFIIWGDITPTRADLDAFVTVYMVEIDESDTTCSSVSLATFRRIGRVPARKWEAVDYQDRRLTAPSDLAASQRRQFELLMPAIRPSRLYCFMFEPEPGRPVTNAEFELLVSRMRPAYRDFLATIPPGEVPQTAVEGLRQQLIRHLLAASPIEGFRPDAGSVFDPTTTAGKAYEEFVQLAGGVLGPQRNILELTAQLDATMPDIANEHSANISRLRAWTESAEFRALEKTATAVEVANAIRYFRGLNGRDRANILLGHPVGSDARTTASAAWEAAQLETPDDGIFRPTTPCPLSGQLASRCGNLDVTRTHLDRLVNEAKAQKLSALATDVGQTLSAINRKKPQLLDVQRAVNEREDEITRQVGALRGTITSQIRVVTTTIADVKTRRTWYLSADTGLAVAPRIGEIFPYMGGNIYFRPVNKEAPPGPFLTRFAAMVGFTWTDNLTKPGERLPLWGDSRMLVFGAGFRFTEVLRLTGGALMLRAENPNPLIEKTEIQVTPFFSVSADIDVAGMFGKIFGDDATPQK